MAALAYPAVKEGFVGAGVIWFKSEYLHAEKINGEPGKCNCKAMLVCRDRQAGKIVTSLDCM